MTKTLLLILLGLTVCRMDGQVYKNPKADVDQRVEDLLSRMTLEEKVAQMNMNGLGAYKKLPNGAGVVESPFINVKEIARMSAETERRSGTVW